MKNHHAHALKAIPDMLGLAVEMFDICGTWLSPTMLTTPVAIESWKASPMTYMMNGRQYIAIASGGNILSFALPDR